MSAQSPQRAITRYKPPLERLELRTSEPRRGDIIVEHIEARWYEPDKLENQTPNAIGPFAYLRRSPQCTILNLYGRHPPPVLRPVPPLQ